LDANQHIVSLGKHLKYYRDVKHELSIQNLIETPPKWQQSTETNPNFGFDNASYWLNFNICGEILKENELIAQMAYPLLDSIELFVVSEGQIIHQEHAGDLKGYSERSIPHRLFLFILLTHNLDEIQVYMRVKTHSSVQLPLTLYTSRGFFIADQKSNLLQGLYFGIILSMIFYNAFLFYSLQDKSYLFYVLYLSSYMGFQATLQGFAQQFFFDSVWLQNNAIVFFGFLSVFLAFRFALSFLNLYDSNPKVSLWLKYMSYVAFLFIPISWIISYLSAIQMMLALAIIGSSLLLYSGLSLWREGDSAARIYTIAWCTILVAFFLASFNKIGVLPRNFFTEDILQFGELIQVMLLAIALGERINYERRRREIAQNNLLTMQQNLTATLEDKVNGRTRELNQTLQQLEVANAELDKISRIDGLTQVGNRRFFDDEFKREYLGSIRNEQALSLILLDIDHFKRLNDLFGHQVGDIVLQDIAKLISQVAKRPGDKVFRYGGEEFVVLLPNTVEDGAKLKAEEIRSTIDAYIFSLEDVQVKTSISAGVAVLNNWDNAIGQEKLLKLADQALYRAKELGRNQVQMANITSDSAA
jgi:diguanylate cyclase